ncbi:MAG TPA: hypothetical protein VFR65_04165 [Nitrososphaeraceae archaeon]|nr:hypothetical protein [Nitrososphaeraceae archaeon]
MKLYSIYKFYSKYREIISFNKNIIIAAIINAIANVFIVNYASIIYVTNYLLISVISIIADFLIYNVSFIILYFIDNRSKYVNPDGSKNNQKIKQDLKKLITIIGLAEISYLATKFLLTFIIFQSLSIDPSLISIITTVLAWIFYIIIANIMARKQKLLS